MYPKCSKKYDEHGQPLPCISCLKKSSICVYPPRARTLSSLRAAPSTQEYDFTLGTQNLQASVQLASGSGNGAGVACQPTVDSGTSNISFAVAQGDSLAAVVSGEK